MFMATPEASESVLAWSWVIEALASCRVVDLDVLHDLIGANPNLPDNLGKEARELVALRCLEALYDPAKMPKNGASLPCNQKEFQFDSSECFTGVLQRVLEHTSVSNLGKSSSNPLVNLRKGASDQLVREVNAFIEHRKTSLPKSALEQLRDRIQKGDNVSPMTDVSKVSETHNRDNRNIQLDEKSPNETLVCSKRDRSCLQNEKHVKDHPADMQCVKLPPRKKLRHNGNDDAVASKGTEMSEDATERTAPQTEPEAIESAHEDPTGRRRTRVEGDKASLGETSRYKVVNQCEGTSFAVLMGGTSLIPPVSEELDVCMKCKEGGEMLVCSASSCQMAIHEGCLGFTASTDSRGDFLCPFCICSAALREYDDAKKKMLLAREQLSLFIGGNPGPSHRQLDQPKGLSNKNVHPSRQGREAAIENKALLADRNSSLKCSSKEKEGVLAGEQKNEEGPREMNVEQFHYAGSSGDNPRLRRLQRRYGPSKNASCTSRSENKNSEAGSLKANPSGNDSRPSSQRKFTDRMIEASVAPLDHIAGTLQDEKCGSIVPSKHSLMCQSQQKLADEERNASSSTLDDSIEVSEDENCKAIVSKYSLRAQRKETSHDNANTATLLDRRVRVSWTAEEVEMLKEGVRRFASGDMKVIPWKTILEFGNSVFWRGRTTVDLKDKWRNMIRQGLLLG